MVKLFSSAPKHQILPDSIKSMLIPKKVLTVVGLTDADIAFAYRTIKNYYLTKNDTSPCKIISIMQSDSLFEHSSVQDNIFINTDRFIRPRKHTVFQKCIELFSTFNININPRDMVDSLANDERKLVEVLRAYVQSPDVLFLYDTMSSFGYYLLTVFQDIINALLNKGCTIIYFSTKWENALTIGSNISIVYRERFTNHNASIEELRANPKRLVTLLSGIEPQSDSVAEYDVTADALNSLYASSQLFIKNNEIEKSLTFMTDAIQTAMHADGCYLYLKNEYGTTHLYSSASSSDSCPSLTHNFLEHSFMNLREINYIHLSSMDVNDYFFKENIDYHYMILAPILNESENIGILQMVFKKNHVLNNKQLLALNAFCNEVTMIVESSRLINQSILLRESHHRIKNNLQNIIGMLYLQSSLLQKKLNPVLSSQDSSFQEALSGAFESIILRIKSISLIHDLLTNNSHGSSYIEAGKLFEELKKLYEMDEFTKINLFSDEIYLLYNHATSIAMIVNELITNCQKHAFTNEIEKIITIKCLCIENTIEITISDNGQGLPEGFNMSKSSGMGMSIVNSLTKTLQGSIKHYNSPGATFVISFSKEQLTSK